MISRLQTILNIKPGEERQVIRLTLYYFFITAISIAGRSVSNALFFSRVPGAEAIFPIMLIPVTITTTLTVTIYSRLARRVDLVTLLTVTGIFFSIVIALLLPFLSNTWALIALYIWMEVLNIVMFFQFYIFAGTIFDTRQAKRIFGILGIGGAFATVLSGLALAPFTSRFGSEAVLIVTIVFILLAVLMVWLTRSYMRVSEVDTKDEKQTTTQRVKLDSYLRSIMAVLACTILVATIVDYQYKVIANRHFNYDDAALSAYTGLENSIPFPDTIFNNDEVSLTAFFGSVAALVGILQLFTRLFVVGSVLTRYGILAGLMVLPIIIGINSTLVFITPVLLTGMMLKTFDQAIRFTLNETSMELLWVPVSPLRKLSFKPFINGTIPSLMQGLAGILIFIIVTLFAGIQIQAISVVVLAVVALWIPLVYRLRQGYMNELFTSIQQHELLLEDLDLDTADATIISSINRALTSSDEVEKAFILNLLENMSLTPWAKTLNQLFHESSYLIRQKILRLAAAYPDIISNEELQAIIEQEADDITDEAIIVAAKREFMEIVPLLEPHLRRKEYPAVRAAAAQAVLLLNTGPLNLARDVLREMLEDRDANANIIALNTMAALPAAIVDDSILRDMLTNRSIRTRALILQVIENPDYLKGNYEIIKIIAANLEKPATRPAAQRILSNYPPESVIEALAMHYQDTYTSEDNRMGIIQTLARYPQTKTVDYLISFLNINSLKLYSEAIHSLLLIAREQPLTRNQLERLNAATLYAARTVYARYCLLELIPNPNDEFLLYSTLRAQIKQMLPILLKLSVMDVPHTKIESIIISAQSQAPQNIANVLEILDNVLSINERSVIIPLFEGRSVHQTALVGQRHFSDLPTDLTQDLHHMIVAGDQWESLIALDYALRHNEADILKALDWYKVPNTYYNSEIIHDYMQREDNLLPKENFPKSRFTIYDRSNIMYSVLEKTIILKKVPFFSDIEPRELFHVAQISDELQINPDEIIFQEGDEGDGLYIIAGGSVRVHRDNREIALLGKNDAVGEMSLFDHLPRSASATSVTQSTLFKIAPDRFYEVMVIHPEIMQAIIRVLSLRLRSANEQMISTVPV